MWKEQWRAELKVATAAAAESRMPWRMAAFMERISWVWRQDDILRVFISIILQRKFRREKLDGGHKGEISYPLL